MENELLENLGRLHTTELGVIRIKKNLSLNVENVIEWCKEKISLSNAEITRKGKNWYITIDNCMHLNFCKRKRQSISYFLKSTVFLIFTIQFS